MREKGKLTEYKGNMVLKDFTSADYLMIGVGASVGYKNGISIKGLVCPSNGWGMAHQLVPTFTMFSHNNCPVKTYWSSTLQLYIHSDPMKVEYSLPSVYFHKG